MGGKMVITSITELDRLRMLAAQAAVSEDEFLSWALGEGRVVPDDQKVARFLKRKG